MVDHDAAGELEQLAARVATIRPMSNTNPHAFYEERSEVASQIRRLAVKLRNRAEAAPSEAVDVPAPIGRQRTSRHAVRDLEGRSVLVLTRSAPLASDNRP